MVPAIRCAWTFRQITPADETVRCTVCRAYYLRAKTAACINSNCKDGSLESVDQRTIPVPEVIKGHQRIPLPPHVSNSMYSIHDQPLGISDGVLYFEYQWITASSLIQPERNSAASDVLQFTVQNNSVPAGTTDEPVAAGGNLILPLACGPLWQCLRPGSAVVQHGRGFELRCREQVSYLLSVDFYRPPLALAKTPLGPNVVLQVLAFRPSAAIHLLQAVSWYLLGLHVWAAWKVFQGTGTASEAAGSLATLVAWATLLTPQLALRALLLVYPSPAFLTLTQWLYPQQMQARMARRLVLAGAVWLLVRLSVRVFWKLPILLQGPAAEQIAISATALLAATSVQLWQMYCGINWPLYLFAILQRWNQRRQKKKALKKANKKAASTVNSGS
jgi:hypothetical protein